MCSAGDLFSIETNRDYVLAPLAQTTVHRALSEYYDLGRLDQLCRVAKPNPRSELQVATCDSGRFVLRRSREPVEGLELRSSVLNRIQGVSTIRPRAGAAGYVKVDGPDRWVCYPWIDGEIWDGAYPGFAEVLDVSMRLLSLLSSAGQYLDSRARSLPVQTFEQDRWVAAVEACLSTSSGMRDALSPFVSDRTISRMRGRRTLIMTLLQHISALPPLRSDTLVHADLNHANLIVSPQGTMSVVDLEDILLGAPQVAIAHAVFKQLRHAVHVGAATVAEAREWCDDFGARHWADREAWHGRTGAADREELLLYGAMTVFEDVQRAIHGFGEKGETWRFYDLEKRLHNLLEMGILFSAQPEAWAATD